jgi:aryl-alcohol dehydrogenase-like predicted oxidoreductase
MSEMISEQPNLKDAQIGVGTWAWGDRLVWGYGRGYTSSDVCEAYNTSIAEGIRLFDTAEIYGQGQSERLLGEFIARSTQPVLVATKFMPYPWRLSRRSLLRALQGSLKRLGLPFVDLYQIHQPLPPINVETWMAAMTEAVQSGLARAVGVSNYDQSGMQRAYDALAREGIHLASNQVEYSLLNRKVEKNGLLQKCQEMDVKLIAYSPLGMGLLTGKYTFSNPPQGIRAGVVNYNRHLLERMEPLMTLMKRIGSDHAGKTPAQVALNWVICKGALPIPGAKNQAQAEQNAGAVGWKLSDEEVKALDDASDRIIEK